MQQQGVKNQPAADGALAARVAPGVTRHVDDVLQGGARGVREMLVDPRRAVTEAVTSKGVRIHVPKRRDSLSVTEKMVDKKL